MGDSEQSVGQPRQPAPSDLTASISNNDDSSQSINQGSPSKRNENSPTKAKNRRKNEARRRSASSKKQAANNDQSETQSQELKLPASSLKSPVKQKLQQETLVTDSRQINDPSQQQQQQQHSGTTEGNNENTNSTNNLRQKQTEINKGGECEHKKLKEQFMSQNTQIHSLVEQVKKQMYRVKELESALLSTNKTCNQLEKLLQQELASRTRIEAENDLLGQTVSRLKSQLSAHEKNKLNNDELMRVLNATLMERETEVSILKLKLTRMQTNPSSTMALNSASSVSSVKHDPCQVYATTGRSSSEFDRNSYIRTSMIAESASVVRASTSQLRSIDKDASVWATVPEELTPSKRPQILEKSFQPLYSDSLYNPYGNIRSIEIDHTTTPIVRDRRYKTLPRSMKSPQEFCGFKNLEQDEGGVGAETDQYMKVTSSHCQVTNLDDSNSTNQSSSNKTMNSPNNNKSKGQTTFLMGLAGRNIDDLKNVNNVISPENVVLADTTNSNKATSDVIESSHYSTISKTNIRSKIDVDHKIALDSNDSPPSLPTRIPTTPVKSANGLKRIFEKFRRFDSSTNSQSRLYSDKSKDTPSTSPFKRGANRSTLIGVPNNIRAQMGPMRQAMNFQTDKPFAEWDTDMLVDWMTMIGLSMYTGQCRRWVKCGAHIMNATPAEVDKGLGITNHLHRKKLRLAISELNGDCDKITKAAAKLDYLWVARWLDDIGLPQYREAFINARIDGRVLNYLTVEDLVSMGVKSVLHHASLRCGIRVLRSIKFDLQLLRRRATAEEVEQMSSVRQQMNRLADNPNSLSSNQTTATNRCDETDVSLWTCHRVMEWLRLIDFAEFAPNLRGSGVHGGLIVFEDGFNIDTMCSLLSIPIERTLLRRHLSTFFKDLIGKDLTQKKRQSQDLSSNQLNPSTEIKTPKKSQLWFTKLKSSKVGQDAMDEYLCPMYPVEPKIVKDQTIKGDVSVREKSYLAQIPESINI